MTMKTKKEAVTEEVDILVLFMITIYDRRLAHAVIERAINDAGKPTHRDDALYFLRGGKMLDFWCQVAGISPDHVRRLVSERWPDQQAA